MTKCPNCQDTRFSEITTLNTMFCLGCFKKYPIEPDKPMIK